MITVIGSANLDLITSVPCLPKPGETVIGSGLLRAPGGKGANQAVAAARAGSRVAFVGRIGDDDNGRLLRRALQDAGVALDFLIVDAEQPSGLAFITVDPRGENEIVVVSGANAAVSPDDIERARPVIEATSAVVMQLEIPIDAVRYGIELAATAGTRIILNAAPALGIDPSMLRGVDVLVANESEVATLTGMGAPLDPVASAQMLLSTGVSAVVLTLGAAGAVIVQPVEVTIEVPAPEVAAVDTTGAGDTFVGNLAAAIDAGMSLVEAARFAVAAAALSVQRRGAQPSMPARVETETVLAATSS